MLPPAVRWLCLLLLTVEGVIGQLSVGDPDSFLVEHLEADGVTPQSVDSAVGDEPIAAAVTELAPEDTTLADLENAVTYSDGLTPETITALEEAEITSVANDPEFGVKVDVDSDVNTDNPVVSNEPQLSRRILVSGTLPATPVVPEASASFSRPSSLVRFLSDNNPGWLPNWPSDLLQPNGETRRPTIRFPTESPPSLLEPTPTPSIAEPAATPIPTIVPSLTISKVPITQYFFDLTSAAPSPPPGPLFDPSELGVFGSVTPRSQSDLNRPVLELASSIPELQSSAFLQTADPVSVTPTLPVPQTLAVTETTSQDVNIVAGTPALSLVPTRIPPSIETEVVDNDLANENYNNVTTLVSDIPRDLDPETSGPQPPQNFPDNPDGNDDSVYTATPALIDTSPPLPPTDPIAVLPEDPPGTGVTQPDPSATSSSRFMSESELASRPSTDSLGSIKPTYIRTLQAANTSRTPLWMLLSQSMPSQSVQTEPVHTTLTSPVVSIPVTDILTATVPTVVLTDTHSDELGEVSLDSDLVSSVLISSKFTSSNAESATTSTDLLITKDPLEDAVPSLVSASSLFSTEMPSTDSFTDAPVSISPTPSNSEFTTLPHTVVPDSTTTTSSFSDSSNDDSVQPLDFIVPTTQSTLETTESNESIPITPHIEGNSSSITPKESSDSVPLNTTIEYHESSEESLIITVPEGDPLQQDTLSTANERIPVIASTKLNSDTWTPVVEFTEKTINNTQTTSSTLAFDTSSKTLSTLELIGGFIPIASETTKSNPMLRSEIMPENANISFTTAATAIVASTTALAESFSTMLDSSPSLADPSKVEESSVLSDRISTSEHPVSSVPIDELISSNLLLSTTTFPTAKSEPTSVSLTPSFNISVSSSQSPFSISVLDSETMTTNLEPSMIVIEKFPSASPTRFPSSSSILVTEVLPSATPSTSLFSLSSTEDINVSSVSSVTSIMPSSTAFPTLLIDPINPVFQPDPSPTSSFPTSDLPNLVTPTVTEETNEVTTLASHPEEPPVGETEDVLKEPSTKDAEETEEVVPEESFSHTTTPVAPTVSTPTISTTTTMEKDITTKMTIPPTSVSSPVPTTPQSTITVTFMNPSESMPSLTTSMTFPNGTVFQRPLPYVRALVAYSEKEFCHHMGNFRTMLAQWISQHLQDDTAVSPSEIEFFNMPQCGPSIPVSEEINHLSESLGGSKFEFDEKLNTSLENEEVTNVYFYVTRFGKINSNLTEEFPLFPMELEISEELTYLRAKVSQLELVRPDGSTDTAPFPEEAAVGTSLIIIIVIVTVVGVTIVTALIFFMLVKRRGSTNNYYGRRCTPVSMDAYSMDSVSVYHSFRRKSKRRASGRSVKSYLNQAFDDPNGPSRPLNFAKLTHFISDIDGVYEEFATIPVNMPKYDELPAGVEDKNRYANVIPVPETRVLLKGLKDSPNCEYINANYVRGPRNESKYYIATQAPLDDTVADFWRMIWEQETRVVVMLTDFVEKGIDKCADYLPPSETLDCHRLYGDFQVTLKSRDMREKFVVSHVQLKNLENNLVREVGHMWFTAWPASGVPNEETAFISYILDVRRTRKKLRAKGPILVHCSPGTGRTGTFLACDLVMRQFEDQRSVDIPRTVYSIRRDRAGAVQTKEQYAFIYRVINLYASKLTTGNLDSL